ncbi:MAG: glycosyltransferase family 39 protein [Candidatus Krumholzibacteriota bacterium]|nr:glycosyltransferase family 39 protein [Candidatus Krumholzibacteriota bacterium]
MSILDGRDIRKRLGKNTTVILIYLLAVVTRLLLLFAFKFDPRPVFPRSDFGRVVFGPMDSYTAPLYPLFIRLCYRIFNHYALPVVLLIQSIVGSLAVFLIFSLVRRAGDRKGAVYAAVITAVYPAYIKYSLSVQSFSFVVLLVLLLMMALQERPGSQGRDIYPGLVAGGGILLSLDFIYFIPGLVLLSKRRLTFLLTLVVVLSPLTISNSIRTRRFAPVYNPQAYSAVFSLEKYRWSRDGWEVLDQLYRNASALLVKSWEDGRVAKMDKDHNRFELKPVSGDNRHAGNPAASSPVHRNGEYAAAYSYLILMVTGIIALTKYYEKAHRRFVIPVVLLFFGVLFLSGTNLVHRAMLEPLLVFYTSILLSRLFSLTALNKCRELISAGSLPG